MFTIFPQWALSQSQKFRLIQTSSDRLDPKAKSERAGVSPLWLRCTGQLSALRIGVGLLPPTILCLLVPAIILSLISCYYPSTYYSLPATILSLISCYYPSTSFYTLPPSASACNYYSLILRGGYTFTKLNAAHWYPQISLVGPIWRCFAQRTISFW